MTAISSYACAISAIAGGAALETTVTISTMDWFTDGTSDDYFAWGFNDASADPLNLPTQGSIANDSFDGFTIVALYYSENTGLSAALDDSIFFGLDGTSVSDSDATFVSIEYDGETYTRSSAHDYWSSVGGVNTFWQWQPTTPNGPVTGTVDLIVNT